MFDKLFNMIDELNYRKLKKSYDKIIESIQDEELDDLKECLDNAYNLAKKLFEKMHKIVQKNGRVNENWKDVERMLENLSTICCYFYGYSAYSNFMAYDDLFNEGYYTDADTACCTARFHKNDSFKFMESPLNESELFVNVNGKETYCDGMQTLIIGHKKAMKTDIDSICLKRERNIRRILEEQRAQEEAEREAERQEYYRQQEIMRKQEQAEHLEKCKRNYETGMERGQYYTYTYPKDSLEWYQYAYDWADGEPELVDEKEEARIAVVDQYVTYINNSCSFFSHSNEQFIISQCLEGISLCEEALKWTHDWDEYKIQQLKSDFEYNLRIARMNL